MTTDRDNPYVGPKALSAKDPFFGRVRETEHLRDLVIADRIVLLYASSGAGKTSLLQAGLIPSLDTEHFRSFMISLRTTRPDKEPAADADALTLCNPYVIATMLSIEYSLPDKSRRPLSAFPGLTLRKYFDEMLSKSLLRTDDGARPVALIFDQFEEVLTLEQLDDAAKLEFFRQLSELMRNLSISAVFAVRDDSLLELDERYARYIPGRLCSRFRLNLLNREQALDAIRRPAEQRGVNFSAANKLADDLLRKTVQKADGKTMTVPGEWIEPVQLQVVCRTLWGKKRRKRNEISEEDLGGTVDVDSALAEYYDDCVAKAATATKRPEREIREWIARNMATRRGVRNRVLREEPSMSAGLSNKVIDSLVKDHILRSVQQGDRNWIELAHDRLVEPIAMSNTDWSEKNLKPFQRAASRWNRSGRKAQHLLRDRDLVDALRLKTQNPAALTQLDNTYIEQSMASLSAFQKATIMWELNERSEKFLISRDDLQRLLRDAPREERMTPSERALLANSRQTIAMEKRAIRTQVGSVIGSALGIVVAIGVSWTRIQDAENSLFAVRRLAEQRSEVAASARALAQVYAGSEVHDADGIAKVLNAQAKIATLSLAAPRDANERQRVDYFSKPGDDPKLAEALKALGFDVKVLPAETSLPTNCVWYGENVPERTVKLIAFAVIRAGVNLQGIEPFVSQEGRQERTQVGSNPRVADETVLTPEIVNSSTLAQMNRIGGRREAENAMGRVSAFNAATREGTVAASQGEAYFHLPLRDEIVNVSDEVTFDLYRNERRLYALYVRRPALAPATTTTTTTTTDTSTQSPPNTSSVPPPDNPPR